MNQHFNYTPLPTPIPITEQVWTEGTLPIVTIVTIAYQHEPYISDCIDGVLMQKTTFPVEFVIHDDASTDKTAKIIREYEKKNPTLFKSIYQSENQYSKKVNIWGNLFNNYSKGKYIALCEGDDYWTDPLKLQKQVDFLEANPDYGMVCSDIDLIDENGNILPDNRMVLKQRKFRKPEVGFWDILNTNLINTLTVCVRSKYMLDLAKHINEKKLNFTYDHWFWLHIAALSKVKIMYEKTASYRISSQGVSRQDGFFNYRSPMVKTDAIEYYFEVNKNGFVNKDVLRKITYHLMLNKYLPISRKYSLLKKVFKYLI